MYHNYNINTKYQNMCSDQFHEHEPSYLSNRSMTWAALSFWISQISQFRYFIKLCLAYDCYDFDIVSPFQDSPMCRLVPYLPTRSDVIGNCWYNPPPNQTTWATKSNLTSYHCLPILSVSRRIPGDDGQPSEMIKYRIGEICRGPGLIWTYILLHWCAREGLTAVLWYATILPLHTVSREQLFIWSCLHLFLTPFCSARLLRQRRN